MKKEKNLNRFLAIVLISAMTVSNLPLNTINATENVKDGETTNESQSNAVNEVKKPEEKPKEPTNVEDKSDESSNITDKGTAETDQPKQNSNQNASNSITTPTPKAATDSRAAAKPTLRDGSVTITKAMLDTGWSAIKAELDKQLVSNLSNVDASSLSWEYLAGLGWFDAEIYASAENGGKGYSNLASRENGTYKVRLKTGSFSYVYANLNLTTSYDVSFTSTDSRGDVKVDGTTVTSKKVIPGDSLSFTVSPDEDYLINEVTVGGVPLVAGVNGVYTIDSVDANTEVSVTYKDAIPMREITVNKTGNGSVKVGKREVDFKGGTSAVIRVKDSEASTIVFVPTKTSYVKNINSDETAVANFNEDRSYSFVVTTDQDAVSVDFEEATLSAKKIQSITLMESQKIRLSQMYLESLIRIHQFL